MASPDRIGASPTQAVPSQAPALAPERGVRWPPRTRRRLANGLDVVLVESHTIPKFTGQLLFRSGNADAAHESPGLAEMTAKVVRTGTAARSSQQIEEELRRLGADLSSSAGADNSAISFSGLAALSKALLEVVADLARNASFPAGELERERRQRLEELRIERTTPGFLAGERLRRVLFGAHPYAVVAPTEQQVEAYQREQLESFYRANYVPGNALLIAVGDFHAQQMMATLEGVFGGWSGSRPAKPAFVEPPRPRGRRVYVVHLPGAVQAQIPVGVGLAATGDPAGRAGVGGG